MGKRKNATTSSTDPASTIPLAQPSTWDRDLSRETLLELAEKRGLLRDNLTRNKDGSIQAGGDGSEENEDEGELEPAPRLAEALVWSMTLTMVHFTLDVLVQNQYGQDFSWKTVSFRTLGSLPIMFLLIYALHPHPHATNLIPGFPALHPSVHQFVFFAGSVAAGCYLVYITNVYGYLAIMKRAPPVGCMWIWSVIELNLPAAVASLICCAGYAWWNGFGYNTQF